MFEFTQSHTKVVYSHISPPLLFLTADTWDDVTSYKGGKLKIGDKSFGTKPSPNPFVGGNNSPSPREVKGSLASLLFLQLKHTYNETTAPSLIDGGGMKKIMESSKGACFNTTNMISKANMAFASHFVQQLSMMLYFNNFETHSRPKKDYQYSTPDQIAAGIAHNQKILLFYLSKIDESRFNKLFPMGYNRALETAVHKIVRAQFDLIRKMKINGIVMSFPSKVETSDGMWIHRFFLMQNICSDIAVRDEEGMKQYTFHGTNLTWKSFMAVVKRQPNDGKLVSILSWK